MVEVTPLPELQHDPALSDPKNPDYDPLSDPHYPDYDPLLDPKHPDYIAPTEPVDTPPSYNGDGGGDEKNFIDKAVEWMKDNKFVAIGVGMGLLVLLILTIVLLSGKRKKRGREVARARDRIGMRTLTF